MKDGVELQRKGAVGMSVQIVKAEMQVGGGEGGQGDHVLRWTFRAPSELCVTCGEERLWPRKLSGQLGLAAGGSS